MSTPAIGFFTRILDDADDRERYRIAVSQIALAERLGFRSAWVAQHHFDRDEGGLPSPFVLLAAAAAATSRIRLATGIVTLAHEHPARVAEDAAVLDALSGGRLELGIGTGASPTTLAAFDVVGDRREVYTGKRERLLQRLRGERDEHGTVLQPAAASLVDRIWQATFSAEGAAAIGGVGDGLMLSRHQPRAEGAWDARVDDIQTPLVDAYLAALPAGAAPRILASRTVVVVDDAATRLRITRDAHERLDALAARTWGTTPGATPLEELLRLSDTIVGTPDDVAEALTWDSVAGRATDVSVQAHSLDPEPALVDRSLELFATRVAPALGWQVDADAAAVSTPIPALRGAVA